MFGIGSTELLLIFVVGLIILGPKNLANMAKSLGKAMGEFRRVSTDFQRTLNSEIDLEEHKDLKKEAEKELFPEDKAENKEAPKAENNSESNLNKNETKKEEILSTAEKLQAEKKAEEKNNEEKA